MYTCPVCGYQGLDEPPYVDNNPSAGSFEICSCCGFQFGVDDLDSGTTHEEHRRQWIELGTPWYSKYTPKPSNWNSEIQLLEIGIKV
ncbi:hypothetical protein PAEAM_42260 [Paenibacillus sp. GM1FR]|nr:hypothetical protein PAEAM_42260 [Paenibacillus sp. GM1FR]